MWIPLESNPEAFNILLQYAGVVNQKAAFTDVYGVSEEMLALLPRPVYAFIFVYPITEVTNTSTSNLHQINKAEVEEFTKTHKFFFTKQTIGNACGMIALLHAVLNNVENIGEFDESSLLKTIQHMTEGLSPEEAAQILEKNVCLASLHEQTALSEVNATQNVNMNTNLHFVCFTHIADRCVELDGRQEAPILHMKCINNDEFVKVSAQVIGERMNLLPNCYDFSIMALTRIDSSNTC